MHFSKMDAYYHLSTLGDREAYTKLYIEFSNKATNLINLLIKTTVKYSGNPDDFTHLIDQMFFSALGEYDASKGSFSSFVEFILGRRLSSKAQNQMIGELNTFAPIEETSDNLKIIETIPDPHQRSMSSDIAINNFVHRISSPNKRKTKPERTKDLILWMQYAGYTLVEISKKVNMTVGELRTYIEKFKDDEDLSNLKLDLK